MIEGEGEGVREEGKERGRKGRSEGEGEGEKEKGKERGKRGKLREG